MQLYTAIILTTFYNLPHKNGANLTTIDIGKGRITFLILTTGAYITTIPFVIGKSKKIKNNTNDVIQAFATTPTHELIWISSPDLKTTLNACK